MELEADSKLTCPHGPSSSFYWPEQDDIFTVSYNQIICPIGTPSASQNGQIHKLSEKKSANNRKYLHIGFILLSLISFKPGVLWVYN